MGTFGGHALPGGFFIVFAVWWTVQIYRRYFRSLRKGGLPFRASATYPLDFLPPSVGRARSWEWEGTLKILFTGVGFALEVITAHHDGRFAYLGNGQHATMFFFFGMSGVVDILVRLRAPLPPGVEYLMATLAFVVEAVLFMFHTHIRTEMDKLIHQLLVYGVWACVATCIVEMRFRSSVAAALARTYCVFLQGTWFWQAGFILYSPLPGAVKWDETSHDQMMIVTMMFAWHMAAVFVAMASVGALVAVAERYCRCCGVARDEVGGAMLLTSVTSSHEDAVSLFRRNGGYSGVVDDTLSESDEIDEVTFQKPEATSTRPLPITG